MEKKPLRSAADESDRKLLADITRVGWHLLCIPEDDDGPSYVFSVGLYHSFDQPELLIAGLDIDVAVTLLNTVGKMMEAGKRFVDLDIIVDVVDDFPLALRKVTEEYYHAYLGYALWFYETMPFPVLQIVLPDKNSRFPWDSNCEPRCVQLQELKPPGRNTSPL